MVGLIWFVQVVHYPLFNRVGDDEFVTYESRHQARTTWVVLPPMLLELVSAVALLLPIFRSSLSSVDVVLLWIGAGLLAVIWVSTGALQVPAHRVLQTGFDAGAYQRLVASNWIRTVAWTARGGVVIAVLY